MTPKSSAARRRIFEEEGPIIVTGRKGRTRQVGDATLLASGEPRPTTVNHLYFDERGNLVGRYVRRIRRVVQ